MRLECPIFVNKNEYMKQKRIMKIALVAVLSVIAGYVSFADNQNEELKGLVLDNVEALATNEGNVSYDCYGSGSVSCYGDYVKYKIEGYSLDIE